jgi:periplasmic protein TonB
MPVVTNWDFGRNLPSTAVSLVAELRPPPAPASAPPLTLPEPPAPAKADRPPATLPKKTPAATAKPAARPAATWSEAVTQQLRQRDAEGLFYPAEAIAQGLQGEVQVLMILDPAGQVSAARVEQGSGHPILDAAALRAVRSLRSLPADAPRQVVLPVRFRLR